MTYLIKYHLFFKSIAIAICLLVSVDKAFCRTIVLDSNSSITDQIKRKATYTITSDINLQGNTIYLPKKSILFFDGGKLYNGNVVFDRATLKGDVQLYTSVSGSLRNPAIHVDWFISDNDIDSLYSRGVFNLEGYKTILLSPKEYVSSVREYSMGLSLHNKTIDGRGCTIKAKSAGSYLESLFILNGAKEVTLTNINFYGSEYLSIEEGARHNIYIYNSSDIFINRCSSSNAFTDGLYIRDSRDIEVNDFSARKCGRQGCSITSGQNIKICNSLFSDSYRVSPMSGLDIEPSLANDIVDNILIDNCKFINNSSSGLLIHLKSKEELGTCNISVNNCEFEGNNVNISLTSGSNSGKGTIRIDNCSLLSSKSVSLMSKSYSSLNTPHVLVENTTIKNANLNAGNDVRESAAMVSVHNISGSQKDYNFGNISFLNISISQDPSIASNIKRSISLYEQNELPYHLENVEFDNVKINVPFTSEDSYSSFEIYAPMSQGKRISFYNYQKSATISNSIINAFTPCTDYTIVGNKLISLKNQVRPDLFDQIHIVTDGDSSCKNISSVYLRYENGDIYRENDIWQGSFTIKDHVVYMKSGTVTRNNDIVISK